MSKAALLICGALGKEVKTIVDSRKLEVDVFGIPATHHFYPKKIVEAVEAKLQKLSAAYDRVVLVYGDCGTAGALDPILQRYGAVRLEGPHCYEIFAGPDFDRTMEEEPATFFLTDWLVRNFERAVIRGLGLDRYPDLKDLYFANYRKLVYLVQVPQDHLIDKAREISEYLELPLEIRLTGLEGLERRLRHLLEAA
jgi:hypothetical protein